MHFQVQHFGSVGTKVGSVGTKGFFGVCSGLVLIRKVSAANRNYDFGRKHASYLMSYQNCANVWGVGSSREPNIPSCTDPE
jgi:hypothetical protein